MTAIEAPRGDEELVELRIYDCVDGRRAQAEEGLRKIVDGLFRQYGFRPIAFWHTCSDGNDQLVYMLAWSGEAERDAGWNALRADPAWQARMEQVARDGPSIAAISSRSLTRLDFGPQAALPGSQP